MDRVTGVAEVAGTSLTGKVKREATNLDRPPTMEMQRKAMQELSHESVEAQEWTSRALFSLETSEKSTETELLSFCSQWA